MRVNEVLSRLDDAEIVKIRANSLCWKGTKLQLLHDEDFYNYKVGDMLVTHLGICDTILGVGLFIKIDEMIAKKHIVKEKY